MILTELVVVLVLLFVACPLVVLLAIVVAGAFHSPRAISERHERKHGDSSSPIEVEK